MPTHSIANYIRTLRQRKRVTQQSLADALGISAQTVSKWETGVSAPDISALPLIARYFGISLDELFGYRPDALSEKQRFLRFMADHGMLRFGKFALHSGRVSPYYVSSLDTRAVSELSKLGAFFARAAYEFAPETATLAVGGQNELPLAVATGLVLYEKYGVESSCCTLDALKNEQPPAKVTLLCDTLTSGVTLRSALQTAEKRCGGTPSRVIVSVDRMERGGHPSLSARREIEREFATKIIPIVSYPDILQAVRDGVLAGDENALEAYGKTYTEEIV